MDFISSNSSAAVRPPRRVNFLRTTNFSGAVVVDRLHVEAGMRRECVVEDLVGDLPAERLQRRRGPGAFHAVPSGEPCVVRPGTLVVPIRIRAVLPRTVDRAAREFRVVGLAANMPGFMAER